MFKHLVDTEYKVPNYPSWEPGNPGASTSSFIQSSINKMWDAIINIDTRVNTQGSNYSSLSNKLNKYPDPDLAKGNAGNYLLSIANLDDNLQMTMLDVTTLIGEHPLSEQVNINSWVHGTGGNIIQAIPMTANNFANNLSGSFSVSFL